MGCGCGSASCGGPPCPYAPRSVVFDVQSARSYAASLGRKLIGPADRMRNLLTRFGMRPYNVRWVLTRWSGGAKGMGEEMVIGEPELVLPTPRVLDLSGVSEIVSPIGVDEIGGVLLTEVSGCYTEDQLRGFDNATGAGPPADQEFFYEIEFLRADGLDGDRRRFTVAGIPEYDAGRFAWRIRLESERQDRRRDGAPDG